MPDTTTTPRSTWFSKFFDCFYLYVAFVMVAYLLIASFADADRSFYTNYGQIFQKVFVIGFGLALLGGIIYGTYWHLKEKRNDIDSATRQAVFKSAISYFIAFTISGYGIAKILRTQFQYSFAGNDMIVGQYSGFELTWYYFAHSYTFACILGCIQIVGGLLLMFRRTRLLATCILLPVMVNIVLIDVFYDVPGGALLIAAILTIGLIHLLLSRWTELKTLFLVSINSTPALYKFRWLKLPLVVVVMGTSFYAIYHRVANRWVSAPFTGKWRVSKMLRNNKPEPPNAWLEHASSFHTIYIEENGSIEFSANPYVYDEKKAWDGGYQFDAKKNILNVFFAGPTGDITKVIITDYKGNSMQWNTIINRDTLQMKLIKE